MSNLRKLMAKEMILRFSTLRNCYICKKIRMIQSMTGYGKSTCQHNHKTLTVEIRSLNSKTLDVNLKLPYIYKSKEQELRSLLGKKLSRGKVELLIAIESKDESAAYSLNTSLMKKYYLELTAFSREYDIPVTDSLLPAILRLPEVYTQETETLDQEEWGQLHKAVEEALEDTIRYRQSEGRHLEKDLRERIGKLKSLLTQIPPLEKKRREDIRKRLSAALEELKDVATPDPNRFEQELIYYLEKFDITEEMVRLEQHLDYFSDTMAESTSAGKKLGFITQEIGREINTIGSKANDAAIQQHVVRMKDELEKIKEQLMNIL